MSNEPENEEEEPKAELGNEKEKKKDKRIERFYEELDELEFYHGNLLDDELKSLMPRKGDFILRMTINVNGGKEVMATIFWNDIIVNKKLSAKLLKKNRIAYTFDEKTIKTTIKDLLQKHTTGTPICIKEESPIMLLNPIAKQAWELRGESVELIKKLGEGAFGEVHSGKLKLRFGKAMNVAVKVIKKTANNEKATTELQKEGSLMRKFKHENVVRTFGMVIERDTIMVVMELIQGGGLNDFVKKNQVSMEEKASFAHDIANGLAYIHSLNCIHRDIACRNCLIDIAKRQAKVSDFGLTRQTEKYKILGNERIPIRWIAPEVLKTYEYTREADIYAYGILVWEIVADGAIPYGTSSNQEIKEGIQKDSYRPDLTTIKEIPQELLETMNRCWSGDSKSRPQMTEVMGILKKIAKKAAPSETDDKFPSAGPEEKDKTGKAKKGGESTKRRKVGGKIKSKDKLTAKSSRRT